MDIRHSDKHGIAPDASLIGSTYRHTGVDYIYTITGFVYHGDTAEWAVLHVRQNSFVVFSRTFKNFFGLRGGKPRFVPCD